MKFNRDNKKYRKIIFSTATLIFLSIILLILLKALWSAYNKEKLSSENLEKQRKELVRLNDRKKNLEQSVEYLKTDKGIEAEIRSKFRVAREGESLAVILDDDATSTDNIDIKNYEKPAGIGFLHRFFFWLGF
jgi:cell division protein FtsB